MQTQQTETSFDEVGYESTLENQPEDGYMTRGLQQCNDLVRQRPASTVLLGLAAGFGIGIFLGTAIGGKKPFYDRRTAESVGRRWLQRLDSIVPDAIADRFHS